MTRISRSERTAIGLATLVLVAAPAFAADVYTGTAKFTAADGKRASVPVTISLDGPSPEAARAAIAGLARNDMAAAKAALASQAQLGYIEARGERVPIRYAYVQPGGDGQIITVISDVPLGYVGGDKKGAKPKEGYELTYAMFTIGASGNGSGEMAPASKVKFMESGAPAVEDYGRQVVWLDDVKKTANP